MPDGLRILVRRSKTDQEAAGATPGTAPGPPSPPDIEEGTEFTDAAA